MGAARSARNPLAAALALVACLAAIRLRRAGAAAAADGFRRDGAGALRGPGHRPRGAAESRPAAGARVPERAGAGDARRRAAAAHARGGPRPGGEAAGPGALARQGRRAPDGGAQLRAHPARRVGPVRGHRPGRQLRRPGAPEPHLSAPWRRPGPRPVPRGAGDGEGVRRRDALRTDVGGLEGPHPRAGGRGAARLPEAAAGRRHAAGGAAPADHAALPGLRRPAAAGRRPAAGGAPVARKRPQLSTVTPSGPSATWPPCGATTAGAATALPG